MGEWGKVRRRSMYGTVPDAIKDQEGQNFVRRSKLTSLAPIRLRGS